MGEKQHSAPEDGKKYEKHKYKMEDWLGSTHEKDLMFQYIKRKTQANNMMQLLDRQMLFWDILIGAWSSDHEEK